MKGMTGGCCCGAVRYETDRAPRRTTYCYCLHCRRLSGSPLTVWAEFDGDALRFVKGQPREYSSRDGVTRTFCRDCGSQLTFRNHATDGIDTTVGTLDEVDSVRPADHVWCKRTPGWLRIDDRLPRHPEER